MGNSNRPSIYKGYCLLDSQNPTSGLFSYHLAVEKMVAQRGKNLAPGHRAKKAIELRLEPNAVWLQSLCSSYYVENDSKHLTKDGDRGFSKEATQMATKHKKRWSMSLNQWKFKSNYMRCYLPPIRRMSNNKQKTSVGEDVERMGPL